MIDQNKPPLDEALLEHFGVKGMRWGVRKQPPRPPTRNQQIQSLTRKIDRVGAETYVQGQQLRGWALKKQYKKEIKKNPKFSYKKLSPEDQVRYQEKAARKVNRATALRGAGAAAGILGGSLMLSNAARLSPVGRLGVLVTASMLAGNVGLTSIQEINAVNKSMKFDEWQRERKQLGYNPT